MTDKWKILKSGIRLYGVDVDDDIWITCCTLHNILLEDDILRVDWTGVDG